MIEFGLCFDEYICIYVCLYLCLILFSLKTEELQLHFQKQLYIG